MAVSGGWARGGKGTSMGHLKESLELHGKSVKLIDQGLKFRAMGEVALADGQNLDSPAPLNSFLHSSKARESTLAVLAEIAGMDEAAKRDRLYTSNISTASRKVAQVPSSHEIAVGLMRTEVGRAVDRQTDVILLDGREMPKYARQFDEAGLVTFALGWFMTCDPVVAARRSLGIFDKLEELAPGDRERLLYEVVSISERNQADTERTTDPMREPASSYRLDLSSYYDPDADTPFKRGDRVPHMGIVRVDTSYTRSIPEMTGPITEVSMLALSAYGVVPYETASRAMVHAHAS